jgi:tryptophan-rich sensory protein
MHWDLFLIFLAASAAAASTGAMFMPGQWYDGLKKPVWVPKRWMFPVVWTVLYLASSVAAARVAVQPDNAMAMAFWAMQVAFNAIWSPMFFGLRRLKGSLIAMGGLWIAVAGMVVTFWPLDWVAGLLVLPYLAWASVAGALNLWVARNNPDVKPLRA